MKAITRFQATDHGRCHREYFSGRALSTYGFANAVIGQGFSLDKAIDDCLSQIEQAGFDIGGMKRAIEQQGMWDSTPYTPSDDVNARHHVSIRWD